ncbi:MAG: carbohydrate porin [Chthoniobacterales bacterium]
MKRHFPGIAVLLFVLGISGAFAADPASSPDFPENISQFPQSILFADGVTGDWWGERTKLKDRGIDIFGGYTAEVWGNTTGGMSQGSVYTGLLNFGINLDLEKAVGWKGASMRTNWLWLSGSDISQNNIGNFLTVSNIAGFDTLRMFELWFQQKLFDDKISLRVGQLGADTEFIISDYGATFINSTFGWPAFTANNLPNGGPAYPVGTPGIRLAVNPVDWFTFQTAAFQGNVYAQNVNRYGFRWRLNSANGYFFINEAQFRWNRRDAETGLPGQFKAGAWFNTEEFTNFYNGNSVYGNYGIYFIVDQMLWRKPVPPASLAKDGKATADKKEVTAAKSDQGLGWFGRIAFDPQDRNFVGFYFDTGLTFKGLIPTRDNDIFGVAFAYAQLGQGAQQLAINSGSVGVGAEMVLEFTYQAQLNKWLSIQPDLQYIINPGGNQNLGNAFVIGGRMSVAF